jgi:hypothetical protein
MLLPLALTACAGGDDSRSISFTSDRGVADQPFPRNFRSEILAFMKVYFTDPSGLHETGLAEPVQRTVGGRLRYVSCIRFAAKEADGSYREPRERAIVYVDGRLDRMAENSTELCAGVTYAPFPELAALVR